MNQNHAHVKSATKMTTTVFKLAMLKSCERWCAELV